jgi:hypothetical protein
MLHHGTVVTDVPLWLLMFHSGYWCPTWRWRHIGTPWPQIQCHLRETLSSPFKRWLDSVNAETEYKVLQVWTFWLYWVCRYFRYVGEILEHFVRAHHCYIHQYFAVRSLGSAADNYVTYTVYLFLANVRVYEFELRVSVHRGLMNKTRCSKSSLFFFVFFSTCFGRYIHPSPGASTVQAGMA